MYNIWKTTTPGWRGHLFPVSPDLFIVPLPKQLEACSCEAQASRWRSLRWRWKSFNNYFPGPYLCQLAAHPPLALVTHLVVEQPPLHIVRDNNAVSDKYFNPGQSIFLKRGFLDSESIGACYQLYTCTFYNLCYIDKSNLLITPGRFNH